MAKDTLAIAETELSLEELSTALRISPQDVLDKFGNADRLEA